MSRWQTDDPHAYDRRWADLAAAGHSIHGETDLVMSFEPSTVLDAGCGTGRVAIELDRRGVSVVGVDVDHSMLEVARVKAPHVEWIEADLASLRLDRHFDVVVMAGNVLLFVAPGTEAAVMTSLAAHVAPNGVLLNGFQLQRGGLDLPVVDGMASAAGLEVAERWATWERQPFVARGATYAVTAYSRSPRVLGAAEPI